MDQLYKLEDLHKPLSSADINSQDRSFYMQLWRERPHSCQCCKAPLYEPLLFTFHHVLEKKPKRHSPHIDYSPFRHCKWNMMLLCWQCHDAWERNPALEIVKPIAAYRTQLLVILREPYMSTEEHIWALSEPDDYAPIQWLFGKHKVIILEE